MAIEDNIGGFGSEFEDDVSALSRSTSYPDIVQKVEELLKHHEVPSYFGVPLPVEVEYQLISDCIQLVVEIEDKVYVLYAFIRDEYCRKFHEVESLVSYPIDYVSAIKKADFEVIKGASDQVLSLVTLSKRLLAFVDSKMVYLAPNLSAIVGTTIAAKLMATAGGLGLLGKMTPCNVQLLGSQRRNLDGLFTQFGVGYLQESEIIQTFPSTLTMGACPVLAATCTTAARIDFMGKDPTGNTGKHLQEVVMNKIKRYCGVEEEHNRVGRRVKRPEILADRSATTYQRNSTQLGVLKGCSPDSRINTAEAVTNSETLVESSARVSSWELQVTNEPKQDLRTKIAEAKPTVHALVGLFEGVSMPQVPRIQEKLSKDVCDVDAAELTPIEVEGGDEFVDNLHIETIPNGKNSIFRRGTYNYT